MSGKPAAGAIRHGKDRKRVKKMDEAEGHEDVLFPERVGDRLRAARTKAGLDLADIATKTRIPQRHLAAIEAGDYTALPALTYCVGFVKAYARALNEDEVLMARDLRTELGYHTGETGVDHSDFEVADPSRIPPRALAWTALAVAILIAGAYGLWRSDIFDSVPTRETSSESMPVAPAPKAVVVANPATTATGEVILTARDDVWFRIYDRNDKVLFEGVKKAGETYAVPADADNPQIRTGRADQIKVTVGGAVAADLGPAETTVKDVGISAAALAARRAPDSALLSPGVSVPVTQP